jgi:exosortase
MSEAAVVSRHEEGWDSPEQAAAAAQADRRAVLFAAVVVVVHLPLLLLHLWSVWQFRPLYQASPLLLAVIGWLAWKRRPELSGLTRPSRWSTVLLASGLLTLSLGVLFFSPWLGALAAVLSAGGLVGRYAVAKRGQDWVPVWAPMWLIVPPPLDGDFRLLSWLQMSAMQMASEFLDVIGVQHLVEGSVLVLSGHRMVMEPAWGGANSPLILLAFTALFVVLARRPLLWSLTLLVSVFAWVWLANVVRVVTVVLARIWFQVDWSLGWQHELLGYGTILQGLPLLASTDYLLVFLLSPIAPRKGDSPLKQTSEDNPVSRGWNWLMGASRRLDTASSSNGRGRRSRRRRSKRTDSGSLLEKGTASGFRYCVWLAAFGLLGVLQVVCVAAPFAVIGVPYRAAPLAWDMPDSLRGWTVVSHEQVERVGHDEAGQFSSQWSLRREPLVCQISLDYPLRGWQEATGSYTGSGWQLIARRVVDDRGEGSWSGPVVEAEFSNETGDYGWLLFVMLDQQGKELRPLSASGSANFAAELAQRSPASRWLARDDGASTETTYRLQAFVTSPVRLSSHQRRTVRDLFAAARTESLVRHLRQAAETEHEP